MGMSRQSSHRAAHLQEGLLGAQQLIASQRGGPVAQGGQQAAPVPTSSCDLVSQSSESVWQVRARRSHRPPVNSLAQLTGAGGLIRVQQKRRLGVYVQQPAYGELSQAVDGRAV